jgi:cysteine desulfurase
MRLPIYLDYSATTSVDSRVVDKVVPWLYEHFGEALSIRNTPIAEVPAAAEAVSAGKQKAA